MTVRKDTEQDQPPRERAGSADRFALIGGDPALDLVNTVSWRGDVSRRTERIPDYAALSAWARRAGLIGARAADSLELMAAADPAAADKAAAAVRDLREQLHSTLEQVLIGGVPAWMGLEPAIVEALGHADLNGSPARWEVHVDNLEAFGHILAVHALELLQSGELHRLGRCENDACGWLFLDRTRNLSRRWCSSTDCGNRERASRHYARHRAERHPAG